jgi:putative membrane protein
VLLLGSCMSQRQFFGQAMRASVSAAVTEAEQTTGAELVVLVRLWSAPYAEASWRAGAFTAFAVLLLVLFLPQEFAVEGMPFDVALGFLLGWGASRLVPPVRRAFALPGAMDAEVSRAASAAMFERGVTRTRGRTGVLVYVSALERRVRVVFDDGLEPARTAPPVLALVGRLEAAVRRFDEAAFVDAVRALGPALAPFAPRAADDENELADEVFS